MVHCPWYLSPDHWNRKRTNQADILTPDEKPGKGSEPCRYEQSPLLEKKQPAIQPVSRIMGCDA